MSEELPVITLTEKTYSTLCFAGTQRNDAGRIVRYADDGRRNVWNDAVWHGKGEFNDKRNKYIHVLCSVVNKTFCFMSSMWNLVFKQYQFQNQDRYTGAL